jgi:hypothetical protein
MFVAYPRCGDLGLRMMDETSVACRFCRRVVTRSDLLPVDHQQVFSSAEQPPMSGRIPLHV